MLFLLARDLFLCSQTIREDPNISPCILLAFAPIPSFEDLCFLLKNRFCTYEIDLWIAVESFSKFIVETCLDTDPFTEI